MPGQQILKTFALATYGTSLSAGRLSADWVPRLLQEITTYPECTGPVVIYDMGHGGWTSLDLLNGAPLVTSLRPTHILTEGGAINDCVDFGSGPVVSRATHDANNRAMIAQWQAGIPGVDITLQTMSSVSSYQTARTLLPTYYADELATALAMGVRRLNNFAGWPNPLNGDLTNGQGPFSIAPTTGYTGQDGGALYSVASPNLTVGADGVTLTFSGSSGWCMARSNEPLSGLSHFELLDSPSNSSIPGIVSATATLGTYPGGDANGMGLLSGGQVQRGGSTLGSAGFSPAASAVTAVEVDVPNQLVYFMNGSVRSPGFSFAAITGPYYWAAGMFVSGEQTVSKFSTNGDGLHPIWAGADDTYLAPNVKALIRSLMTAFWP